MGFNWKISEMCLRYALFMLEICLRNSWDLPEICQRIAWNFHEISIRFSFDMYKIGMIYNQDMSEIRLRFAWGLRLVGDMPEICLRDMHEIWLRIQWKRAIRAKTWVSEWVIEWVKKLLLERLSPLKNPFKGTVYLSVCTPGPQKVIGVIENSSFKAYNFMIFVKNSRGGR